MIKRLLLLILTVTATVSYMMADITISVPKRWKGRTLYIWQTDINQCFNSSENEPLHQIKDTVKIKDLSFTLPIRFDCATKVDILSPKKDESDYDHTIGEACVMPGEDVHVHLDHNSINTEGSQLNQQMAEIYTHYMQTLEPFKKATASNDQKEATRIAKESRQWFVDWIRSNPGSPAAGAALYQIANPETVVELSGILQGEALTSMFYPYAEYHINRCRRILSHRQSQASLDGQDAPGFTLTDITGNRVSLSDFRGKWVIVDFWGSWCAPCLKGMPELKELYDAYAGSLEIIGIDCNDTEEAWKNTVDRLQLPWVQLFHTDSDKVISAYAVTAFPTKAVIDPEGRIKRIYTGASPGFREDITNWLN